MPKPRICRREDDSDLKYFFIYDEIVLQLYLRSLRNNPAGECCNQISFRLSRFSFLGSIAIDLNLLLERHVLPE